MNKELRRYQIQLFNLKRNIQAPFKSKEEVDEFCQHLEKLITFSIKGKKDSETEKNAQAVANIIFNNPSLLRVILNIGYELHKLKKQVNSVKAELELKIDEALQILDKIKKGED